MIALLKDEYRSAARACGPDAPAALPPRFAFAPGRPLMFALATSIALALTPDSRAGERLVSELPAGLLHEPADYIASIPEDLLAPERRARLFRQSDAPVEQWHSGALGTHVVSREFRSNEFEFTVFLMVFRNELLALAHAEHFSNGVRRAIGKDEERYVLRELPWQIMLGETGAAFVYLDNADIPMGNIFLIRSGARLYGIEMFGLGGMVDPEQMESFLAPKASHALDFQGDQTLFVANSTARNARWQVLANGAGNLVVAYALIYLLGSWIAGSYRRVVGKESDEYRSAGTKIVWIVASCIAASSLLTVVTNDLYAKLPSEQQAWIIVETLAVPLLPAVLLTALASLAGMRPPWCHRPPARNTQSSKGSLGSKLTVRRRGRASRRPLSTKSDTSESSEPPLAFTRRYGRSLVATRATTRRTAPSAAHGNEV